MRRGQYSVEQIIGILKQYESGRSAKELCRQYGFSDQTLKRWKAKYKGMHVEEAKRLRALEASSPSTSERSRRCWEKSDDGPGAPSCRDVSALGARALVAACVRSGEPAAFDEPLCEATRRGQGAPRKAARLGGQASSLGPSLPALGAHDERRPEGQSEEDLSTLRRGRPSHLKAPAQARSDGATRASGGSDASQ
jgi:hypothetical protein